MGSKSAELSNRFGWFPEPQRWSQGYGSADSKKDMAKWVLALTATRTCFTAPSGRRCRVQSDIGAIGNDHWNVETVYHVTFNAKPRRSSRHLASLCQLESKDRMV